MPLKEAIITGDAALFCAIKIKMALEECILADQKGPASEVAKAYNLLAEQIIDQFLNRVNN